MTKDAAKSLQMWFRVEDELYDLLAKRRAALQEAMPGMNISMSDVVRATVRRGLVCRDG